MRDDDQVKAGLAIKKNIVISTGFEIVSEHEEAAEFFKKELETLHADQTGIEPGFEEAVKEILSCFDYGFSLTEPVFQVKETKSGPVWGIKCLKTRPPHGFMFDLDRGGNILKIRQEGTRERIEFKPDHFIHIAYQSDFGSPYGKSDFKAAHLPWKIKKFIDKFFPIYLERYAAPFVVARYEDGAAEAEIDKLQEIVDRIQITTGMVIPKDTEIELVETTKDSSAAYQNAIEHYNMRIMRALLVPDLVGMGGSKTDGGSFALGEKHFGLFMEMVNSMRKSIARTINSRIIRPLALVNFGEAVADQVEFRWLPFREDLLVDHFSTWAEAMGKLRVKPTPEQINHMSKSLGFPVAEEVEMLPDPQEALPTPGPSAGPRGAGPARSPAPRSGSKPEDDTKRPTKKDYAKARALTAFESKMDFEAIESALDSAEESIKPTILEITGRMQKDYLARIKASTIIEKADVERLSGIQFKYQKELNRAFADYFESLYTDAASEAAREILPRGAFNNETPLTGDIFVDVVRAESFKIVGDYSFQITKTARNFIVQGMKDGIGTAELFRIVREEMAEESDRWVRTVLRTKTTEIYNEARKIYWETDPIASQIVVAYQWSSIIDSRTSHVCRFLDGKVFKISDFTNRVKPPAHFNCRSLLVPVTKFEKFTESEKPDFTSLANMGGNLILGGKA